MLFSVRVAPGVRVRLSSRGVRTSIGPRAARLHVGGGRTGFSTGAGPVTFYSSLGGGSTRSGIRSTTPSSRSLTAAAKAQQAQELAAALGRILDLHRVDFSPARPPVAPDPRPPDTVAITRRHLTAATKGVGMFSWGARREAKERAVAAARVEIQTVEAANAARRAEDQRELDALWARLLANDPDVVLPTLAEAFEDNEAQAAAIGVDGGDVSLLVLVPDPSELPERKPDTTPAGNLTLKRLTKAESAELYRELVCGHVLATVKEVLAVAPGATGVSAVAVRRSPPDAYGKVHVEAVLAAHLTRAALQGIRWADAGAYQVLQDAADSLTVRLTGRSKDLAPLELGDEPDVARAIAAIDDGEVPEESRP